MVHVIAANAMRMNISTVNMNASLVSISTSAVTMNNRPQVKDICLLMTSWLL